MFPLRKQIDEKKMKRKSSNLIKIDTILIIIM